MEDSGNGLDIQNVPNRAVVELKVAQENVTIQLHQMVVQIVLVRRLKHVNVILSPVL